MDSQNKETQKINPENTNQESTPKRGKGRPKAIPNLVCPVCGNKFHRAPSQIKAREKLFCSHKCVGKWYNAEAMNTPEQKKIRRETMSGENHPNWKGGTYINSRGEKMIYYPRHRRAWKNGYVPQKYLLLEELSKKNIDWSDRVKIESHGSYDTLIVYSGLWMNKPIIKQTYETFIE